MDSWSRFQMEKVPAVLFFRNKILLDDSVILLTERKENPKNNQETTAQNANHVRIRCKLTERFPNIRDYITSQSNPSSQISTNIKRKVNPNKRNYKEGNNYHYYLNFKKSLSIKKSFSPSKTVHPPPWKAQVPEGCQWEKSILWG